MTHESKHVFLNGYSYTKQHPELWFTLMLVIVVPIAFVLSGQQFLNASRDNQGTLESERIGLLHDLFAVVMRTSGFDKTLMQNELTRLSKINEDISQFMIFQENGPYLTVVASLDVSQLGTVVENPDEYRKANVDPTQSILNLHASEKGVRFWRGVRLVQGIGDDRYYIFTETSLAQSDALFAARVTSAYYWLFALLAIVMYLILRHVRLIDYAYLYSETKKDNQARDLFTTMVAHELRAPLTAIRGYASMIVENKNADSASLNSAQRVMDASERLMLIVTDLIDVTRIHSGKLSVVPVRTDIQKIITSVLNTMQIVAHEKNISVVQEGVTNPVLITIDEKRFHQALTNLVSNSIKYSHVGEIKVSLEERSDRIELRVKDTGMGISAENQKNLFAPFFRVDAPEVNQTVGAGLGMWITKQLIELMNGSIGVESIKGVGTHIVVTLPKK